MIQYALGLIETRGLVGAIEAADAALKTSHVELIGKDRAGSGLITIKLAGETAAVRSAVEAGAAAAQRIGELVSTHVIPRPHEELLPLLENNLNNVVAEPSATHQQKTISQPEGAVDATSYQAELEKLTVHQLRTIARSVENLPIQGRQISMANKKQLIQELLRARFG